MTVSSRPTVSVIVPARNEEPCLGACLESLAGQTGCELRNHRGGRCLHRPHPRDCAVVSVSARGGCWPTACQAGREKTTPWRRAQELHAASGCCSPTPTPSISPARWLAPLRKRRQHGARSAFLLSRAGSSRILGKGGDAGHFCRTGGDLPAFPGERSPVAGGGCEWPVHPDFARSLRRGRRPRGGEQQSAGRRGAWPEQ